MCGTAGAASDSCDVKAIHEAGVAAVVVDPPEDFLAAADEAGLAIIGVAEADDGRSLAADEIVDRIGRWSMHPAVVIASPASSAAARKSSGGSTTTAATPAS